MTSWNIVDNCDGTYTLLNDSGTLIKKHKRVPMSRILELLSKMEEIKFPISHTEGLEEINFTYLKGGLEGDYNDTDETIRVACNKKLVPSFYRTFVHEVGHHVDVEECVSEKPDIVSEWQRLSSSFTHVDMKRDVCEYVAEGFEHYYMSRLVMSSSHPVLWRRIDEIHKKTVADKVA